MTAAHSWNQVVVGCDPGMTTGLAWAEGVRCADTHYRDWWDNAYKTSKNIYCFGLGPEDLHEVVMEFMFTVFDLWSDCDSMIFVCEDFLLRPSGLVSMDREALSPSIIGTLLQHEVYRMVTSKENVGVRRYMLQRELPSTTMSTITDERLKIYGEWDGLSPHRRDAWRCVLTGLRKFHSKLVPAA